jgi:hypothetical protein
MEGLKPGTKLGCQGCGTEVIFVRVADAPPSCCGQPLAAVVKKEQNVGE